MKKENPRNRNSWVIVLFILAVLCVLYGFVAYRVHSGKYFFLLWFLLGGVLALCGCGVKYRWWMKLPKAVRRIILAGLVAAAICCMVSAGFIMSHFFERGEPGLDYIIVLGAQVRNNGPSIVLRYRLDTAIDYLNENPDTICITTGGQGSTEPMPEGEAMRDYLVEHGIAEERILVENTSRNTVANLRNSLDLLDSTSASVGIITNNFHIFRGTRIAEKQGLQHVCGIAAPSHPLFLPNNLLREILAVIKDAVVGNL